MDRRLAIKRQARWCDEDTKALDAYREEELAVMAFNFNDAAYHERRRSFVYKR
ncbi:MAG: hypothetical protein NVSMB32_16340 [Actinomycetota bacterium]